MQRHQFLCNFGVGGLTEVEIDFSVLPDGALPASLTGSTWSIASGKATNSPILGGEMLTDPGLEANYTAGKCDTLVIDTGTWTLAQSADVHGGSKAQEATASSQNGALRFNPRPNVTTGQWYQASLWGKRTAGANGSLAIYAESSTQKPATPLFRFLVDAAYTQKKIVFRAGANTTLSFFLRNSSTTYDTAIVDDGSLKPITFSTLLATTQQKNAGWTVRAAINLTEGLVGIASHVDDPVNPQNGIFAYWYRSNLYAYYTVEKLVNGSWSVVVAPVTFQNYGSYVPGKIFEIRYISANTFGLFYDNAQLGTNLTINDATIIDKKYYGMLAAGGSAISGFFCGATVTSLATGAFGSSVTEPTTGYVYLVKDWIAATNPDRAVSLTNQARSGNWPWSNLVRFPAEMGVSDRDIVLCDYRAVSAGRETKGLEALTRKIYTANPNAVIISPIFPVDADSSGVVDDLTQVELDADAMAAYYGVHLVDYRQEVIDRVTGGELLSVYMADTIHPTTAGHVLCAEMIETAIEANGWLNPEDHSTLPARLYDDGYYENTTPQRINGVDNDGVTGSWTTTGTRIESSSAGATVTFVVTCRSFGLYSAGTANTVCDVQVDGAAWQENVTVNQNGQYFNDLSDAEHTIIIRVRAGVAIRIDEFWAI